MVILGLLLIAGGALVVLAGLFTATGTAQFLGTDVSAASVFVLGVVAGVAVLWGFSIAKFGTKRSLQHRRDAKRLSELSEKLDRVESERRDDDRSDGYDDTDTREQRGGEHRL